MNRFSERFLQGPLRSWPALLRASPFVVACVGVSWLVAITTTKPEYGHESSLVFHVPDLLGDTRSTLTSLFTAPLFNRGPVQTFYVTAILLSVGVMVESREGTLRTALMFFGCSAIGALFAAALLLAVYPTLLDHTALTHAYDTAWGGGSAGAIGLFGSLTARSRRPGLLACLYLCWEANVAVWRLRNYTPIFHLAAFGAGFVLTRYVLPAPAQSERSPSASAL